MLSSATTHSTSNTANNPKFLRVGVTSPTDNLEKIFTLERGFEKPIILNSAMNTLPASLDLVVFSGGADVCPELYGQTAKAAAGVYCNKYRDEFEMRVHSRYWDVKKIGVCRGAQLLCVLNGGSLWQNADGHQGHHYVYDLETQKSQEVTSVHHQICRPTGKMKLLAHAMETKNSFVEDQHIRLNGIAVKEEQEVEAFWIPNDKALCVQWHPEYGHKNSEDYFWTLVNKYLEI